MSTTISLNPSNGIATLTNTARSFDLVAMPESLDGNTVSTVRINPAAALGSPQKLLVSHQYVKAKAADGIGVDRHVVRFDQTAAANGTLPEVTMSVYLNIIVPRAGFTTAEVKDGVGLVVDFINDLTVLGKLLLNNPIAEA